MFIDLGVWKALFSWCPPFPLSLRHCLLTFLLSPEVKDLMETPCLGVNILRSLTLCIVPRCRFCVDSHLLLSKASLTMNEKGTDLQVWLNVIRSYFISTLLFYFFYFLF